MRKSNLPTPEQYQANLDKQKYLHGIIENAIKAHLEPFDPGLIIVQRLDDLSRPTTFVITCTLLVDDVFTVTADEIRGPLMGEEEVAYWLGNEAGAFWSSCRDEVPGPNIILGED